MVKRSRPHTHPSPIWGMILLIAWLGPFCRCHATTSDTLQKQQMIATFYADGFHGRRTASGEIFDQNKATAAHISIKLGTWVRVTNLKNDMQVVVKINDRCPKRGVLDLSRSAARSIGIRGTAKVSVEILPSEDEALKAIAQTTDENNKQLNTPQPITTSRTTNSSTSSTTKKQKAKASAPTPKKEVTKKAQPHANKAADTLRYNIILGSASTLKEAESKCEYIPIPYHGYVKLMPNSKQADILIILEVRLPRKKAEQILQKTSKCFPDGRIIQIKS